MWKRRVLDMPRGGLHASWRCSVGGAVAMPLCSWGWPWMLFWKLICLISLLYLNIRTSENNEAIIGSCRRLTERLLATHWADNDVSYVVFHVFKALLQGTHHPKVQTTGAPLSSFQIARTWNCKPPVPQNPSVSSESSICCWQSTVWPEILAEHVDM